MIDLLIFEDTFYVQRGLQKVELCESNFFSNKMSFLLREQLCYCLKISQFEKSLYLFILSFFIYISFE